MTTREEMSEALNVAAEADRRNADTMWQCGMSEAGNIAYRQRELALDTASQLKRDGELRERLKKLVEELRKVGGFRASDDAECAIENTRHDCADEIEALLKEFP